MSDTTQSWRSNGKLLLTGEYLVMEGAKALALPINLGQSLTVNHNDSDCLIWNAHKPGGSWFTATLKIPSLDVQSTSDVKLSNKLRDILLNARSLSESNFLKGGGVEVETNLEFNPEYGFGTSSTLISNIANWLNINPYDLLSTTFGGSGYDIACARSNSPIIFQRKENEIQVADADFNVDFNDSLYFVYLGAKQSSAKEISNFKKNCSFNSYEIDSISAITDEILSTNNLSEFEELIAEHESIMSTILKLKTAKETYFPGFLGAVKSLGAWGGDFVLITSTGSEKELRNTMKKYGFDTMYTFNDLMIK